MFRQLFKNKIFWIGLIIILFLVIVPVVVNAQFDINNGIVGNLANKECSVKGNCGFCDWIDLFLVLQKVILSCRLGRAQRNPTSLYNPPQSPFTKGGGKRRDCFVGVASSQ